MWKIVVFTALSVLALTVPTTAWAKIALFGLMVFIAVICLIKAGIAETDELLRDVRQRQNE